jgi:hypothetical protein
MKASQVKKMIERAMKEEEKTPVIIGKRKKK